MPQYRCQRTVRSVNPLLSALLKCGAFDKMKEVLSSIDKYGKPDACTYNILINGYSQSGCFDDALKLFEEMVKKKVKPTGVTFGTLVNELCKNFKVKEALKMKHHMLKVYGVCPTVHVYASLIKALCQIGELSLAFKLKDEAYEGKIKVDSAIYSTLISSIIKAGRSAEVTGILEEMRKKGCEPDTVTYNVLTNGFCVENDLESAYRVLDEMVDKGVKPDIISYNMILGALFRIKNWKEGAYLFEDMPRRGCIPDILSYRIVFDGLCEGSQFEEAAVVLDEMLFKSFKPRKDRLEIFLQRLCQSGKLEILGRGSFINNAALLDHPTSRASEDMKLKLLLFKTETEPGVLDPSSLLLSKLNPFAVLPKHSLSLQSQSASFLFKKSAISIFSISQDRPNVAKVLDIGRSCATIAFDYFTQKLMEESGGNYRERNDFKRMRRVFEYIEDADIWKWELPGSKAFNSGIVDLGIEYDLNQNQTLFQKLLSLDHESVIHRGKESLSRKHKLIQEALEQSYEIVLGGDEEFGWCLAVNADENAELRSELGNQLAEKRKRMRLRGVGAVVYRVPELEDAAKLKISLRSVAEEDTTQVSQRFGGGGHKNSSSLLLSSVELEQWKVKRN
ncbi:hypothetical protein HID58_093935 [Brassica napus]|uniref:Pentatricopeptide repeat-containing protein n=1 Tax=Brassica napus TaxID=3708 RepID=A0ABQ7XBL0_BRANA|nr:hypothetical protein HID58_093935 [Brassica napus]